MFNMTGLQLINLVRRLVQHVLLAAGLLWMLWNTWNGRDVPVTQSDLINLGSW